MSIAGSSRIISKKISTTKIDNSNSKTPSHGCACGCACPKCFECEIRKDSIFMKNYTINLQNENVWHPKDKSLGAPRQSWEPTVRGYIYFW